MPGASLCRWAFSIWGIIFLLQGLGVVYQWLPQGYGNDGWKARIINTIGACTYKRLHSPKPHTDQHMVCYRQLARDSDSDEL